MTTKKTLRGHGIAGTKIVQVNTGKKFHFTSKKEIPIVHNLGRSVYVTLYVDRVINNENKMVATPHFTYSEEDAHNGTIYLKVPRTGFALIK
jgi:hypothetical protein